MKFYRKNPSIPIKAVVYDLDATLLDTEDNWYIADKRMMDELGLFFDEEMKRKYVGMSIDDMITDLKEKYSILLSQKELRKKKNELYLDIALGNTFMFPEMKLFYNLIKETGLPFTIASGTAYDVIEKLVNDLGIKDDFTFILSAEMVERGKPYPDIYIETARRLELKPEEILVIEDSKYGVQAAKSAGLLCVAIPYLVDEPLDDVFYTADILVEEGMKNFDPHALLDWMKHTL